MRRNPKVNFKFVCRVHAREDASEESNDRELAFDWQLRGCGQKVCCKSFEYLLHSQYLKRDPGIFCNVVWDPTESIINLGNNRTRYCFVFVFWLVNRAPDRAVDQRGNVGAWDVQYKGNGSNFIFIWVITSLGRFLIGWAMVGLHVITTAKQFGLGSMNEFPLCQTRRLWSVLRGPISLRFWKETGWSSPKNSRWTDRFCLIIFVKKAFSTVRTARMYSLRRHESEELGNFWTFCR